MNFSSVPQSDVPAICIHRTDDVSALFNGGEIFSTDMDNYLHDDSVFACSQGLQTEFLPSMPVINTPSDLEDLSEFSHLSTTNQPYLTGNGYAFSYVPIVQENTSTDRLSPSCLGSPLPSPTSSFGSSLSPSSFCDSFSLSDSDSFLSSPVTPDSQSLWSSYVLNHQSNESLVSHSSLIPSDAFTLPGYTHAGPGPHRPRSQSSPSRGGPVASKAMLEANGRRRRHPAQFKCDVCTQTFTALFSLKRHMQSHTGERPFACGISGCSQRFYNSSDCKRHERSLKRHKDLQ